MSLPTKTALLAELARHIAEDLATLERAQREAHEAATHEEAKPEDDKDTRALEQSYLARGQAQRVEELRRSLAETEALSLRAFDGEQPIALGALVTADEGGEERRFFLVPHRGGTVLAGGVQAVTPRSPLGLALVGKRAGDAVELRLAAKVRELEIVQVA